MNETVWMISPNWLAWLLLGLSTASLILIAVRLWSHPRSAQATQSGHGGIIAWIALILSLIAVIFMFFKTSACDASILIAAFGVMVTLLVGWQIFNLINLNQFENRFRESDVNLHLSIGEICGDMSSVQPNDGTMTHVALLFTIHALIHYSQIGEFDRCEREIDALIDDSEVFSSNDAELSAMYHRMTGRISHTERIRNFGRLIDYINRLFTQTNHPA